MRCMGIDDEIIKQRIRQIRHFLEVEHAHRGATILWQSKEDFGLSGDFDVLEDLFGLVYESSNHYNLCTFICWQMDDKKNQRLNAITENMMGPFEDLKGIKEEHILALNAFRKSIETIKWLRQNVKGGIIL